MNNKTFDDILKEVEIENKKEIEAEKRLLKHFLNRGIKNHYVDYLIKLYGDIENNK
jgi:hypothetical protein